jgi:hypothetical protein
MAASALDDALAVDDVFASLNKENRERSAFSTSSPDNVVVDVILLVVILDWKIDGVLHNIRLCEIIMELRDSS